MEGQVGRGDPDPDGDFTGGEARGAGLDEQPEDPEPRLLCKRAERTERQIHFHISRIVEILERCQGRAFSPSPAGFSMDGFLAIPALWCRRAFLSMLQRDKIAGF
jgi:hypothetical protein